MEATNGPGRQPETVDTTGATAGPIEDTPPRQMVGPAIGPQQMIGPVRARTATNAALPLSTNPADRYEESRLQPTVNPFLRMGEKRAAAAAEDGDMPELAAHERDRILKQKKIAAKATQLGKEPQLGAGPGRSGRRRSRRM